MKATLLAAGWTIVKDTFTLPLASSRVEMDLLVEKTESDGRKNRIVIEVKNFREETSYVSELQKSIGQYLLYREILDGQGYTYPLYLAAPITAYPDFLNTSVIRRLLQKYQIQLLLFDPQDPTLLKWNP